MRVRLAALALAGCTAVSACGSTVGTALPAAGNGLGAPAVGAQQGELGVAAPTDALGVTTGEGSSVDGAPGGTSGPAAAPGSSGAAGSPTGAGSASTGSAPVAGSGGSGSVEVGFVVYPDLAAFAQAFGGSGESFDQKALVNTAVRAVNARGGLAGRRIVPVFYEVELTSAKPYSQSYQEICESFTKDHKTIATVMIGNAENDLPLCLARGGSAFFNSGAIVHDAQDYQQVPSLVSPAEASASRAFPELIKVLTERQALKRGDKVGLLHFEYPGSRRAALDVVKPLLTKLGVTVYPYQVQYPQSTPDIANSGASVQSAVLRFQAEGVSTVMFTCPGCFTFFLQYAENQAYYPRYALTSLESLRKDRSAYFRSLESAVAIGYQPAVDLGTYSNPKLLAGNTAYTQCKKEHGSQIRSEDTEMVALIMCGLVRTMEAAAEKVPAGAPLDARALLAGVDRLGSGTPFPANFTTTLQSGRRDGSSTYRVMRFDSGRRVFVYESSANRSLP